MITMRQLEALRAVIENQTVTGAANFMRLSQPAISKLISNLEAETRLTLFRRDRRRLEPTPEALILYEQSLRIFDGLNEISRVSSDLRNLKGGRLNVFSLPALGKNILPKMLSNFMQVHDRARIGLHVHTSQTVLQAVVSGRVDLGLSMVGTDHPGVDCRVLCRVEAVCALPVGHRLETRDVITTEDLAGESFISFGHEARVRELVDGVFEERGVTRQLRIETHISESACAFVANGAGVSLVDPFTAGDFAGRNEIRVRPFSPAIPYEFYLLTQRGQPLSLLAQSFIDVLNADLPRYAILNS